MERDSLLLPLVLLLPALLVFPAVRQSCQYRWWLHVQLLPVTACDRQKRDVCTCVCVYVCVDPPGLSHCWSTFEEWGRWIANRKGVWGGGELNSVDLFVESCFTSLTSSQPSPHLNTWYKFIVVWHEDDDDTYTYIQRMRATSSRTTQVQDTDTQSSVYKEFEREEHPCTQVLVTWRYVAMTTHFLFAIIL